MNYRRRRPDPPRDHYDGEILSRRRVVGRLEHVAQIEVGEEWLHRVLPDLLNQNTRIVRPSHVCSLHGDSEQRTPSCRCRALGDRMDVKRNPGWIATDSQPAASVTCRPLPASHRSAGSFR